MKKKKYWYRFYLGECPVCGKDKSYKMRVYGKKPHSWNSRYFHRSPQECYDWCDT